MAHNVWDDVPDWGGVGALRLDRAGALGAAVWELQPGQSQFVYHFHHASEELLLVLRGAPTVRMHDGEETARVLIVSTNANPDVAEYDSGKLAAIVDGKLRVFRLADAVEHAGPD
jgi:hypothetical protein